MPDVMPLFGFKVSGLILFPTNYYCNSGYALRGATIRTFPVSFDRPQPINKFRLPIKDC
jgi:hypothetical protein